VPKANWPVIATLVRSIVEQPDRDATCDLANDVPEAADDIVAFSAFPVEHWPQIRSNNPRRPNKEIRRRTDVVGSSPTGPE
jgi:putative transposase